MNNTMNNCYISITRSYTLKNRGAYEIYNAISIVCSYTLKHSCSLWVGSNSFADKLINHVSASATKQRARSAACTGQWVPLGGGEMLGR